MSDTQVLPLPERDIAQISSRKKLYEAGKVNTFTFEEDGQEHLGYIVFPQARLISVTGRVQATREGNKALVVTQGIIIDEPEIGVIEDDVRIPHDMITQDRYASWRDERRPKRVNAQQWVQKENRELVRDYVNYLHNEHGFSVIQNPAKREGSQRKTQDLFVARPSGGRDPATTDRNNYGVPLDSFEISVNPDYEAGFNSFAQGIEEQRARWEAAVQMEDDDLRKAHLEQIAQNIHFLGGVYRDEDTKTWWARPVDVGMVIIDGKEFALYQQRGSELTDDLFSELDENGTAAQANTGLSVNALSLPDADDEEPF